MVGALNLTSSDFVLEVGPGAGAVTRCLLEIPDIKVVAVEIDPALVEALKKSFGKRTGFQVINTDILDYLAVTNVENCKIVGSLPYNITSPLLHLIIEKGIRPTTCIFLVQKEVGEKICSGAPEASYMSSFVQTFFSPEYITTVEKTLFNPIPKVDGAIIKLVRKEGTESLYRNVSEYEKFLHRAYSKPRKMLNKIFTREELEKIGMDGSLRAQNIDPEKWIEAFISLEFPRSG